MSEIEYFLFRIKFVASSQISLFPPSVLATSEVFRLALEERPSVEKRETLFWRIGNLQHFSRTSGSFAIGRTTTTTLAKFDPDRSEFMDGPFQDSPYTYCVYDLHLGLVAIARKSRLGSITSVSKRLSELLSATEIVQSNNIDVLVDPIPDPETFLRKIQEAEAVHKFKATFTGPNPFDADGLFQRPLSVYCQRANGRKGSVEIEGAALNKEVVVNVARSTAATGNKATARISYRRGGKAQNIELKGDQVKRVYSADDHDKAAVAEDMRAEYAKVRNT